MNYEEQQEYQEKMGSPEMEYLQYLSEQEPEEETKHSNKIKPCPRCKELGIDK